MSLIYLKIVLHTDILYFEAVSEDIVTHGLSTLKDWKLAPAPAYFPELLFYFVGYNFLPNPMWNLFFVTLVQVFLLGGATIVLAKTLNPKITHSGVASLIVMLAWINYFVTEKSIWFYVYSNNNHLSALIFSLFALVCVSQVLKKEKWRWHIVLITISILAVISSKLYVICFLTPALFLTLLSLFFLYFSPERYKKIQDGKNKLWALVGSLGLSIILGLTIYHCITYYDPLKERMPFNYNAVVHSFHLFLKIIQPDFVSGDYFSVAFIILLPLAFLFVLHQLFHLYTRNFQGKRSFLETAQNSPLILSGVFLIAVVLANIGGVILSGGLVDMIGYRYFFFPLFLIGILTIILIDNSFLKGPLLLSFLCWGSMIGISLLSLQIISQNSFLERYTINSSKNPFAQCLAEAEKEGFILKAGIADYWGSRGVSIFLEGKNPILATYNNLEPFFWISSLGPLIHKDRFPKSETYNFVLLRDGSPPTGPFDYNLETIGKILPSPSKVVDCPLAKGQVWLYEGNTLNDAVKKAIDIFLARLKLS